MARRRHRRHIRHHRRRHRVGAINVKQTGTKIIGVAGGAFVGRMLQNMATKSLPSISPRIMNLGLIVIGEMVIPRIVKGDIGQSVGDGITAIAVLSELQSFGMITGVGAVPGRRVPSRVIRGYNPAAPAVGAYNKAAPAVGQGGAPVNKNIYNRRAVFGMPDAHDEMMMGSLLYED